MGFHGEVVREAQDYYFASRGVKLRVLPSDNDKLQKFGRKKVTMGIRSEDIYDKLFASEASPDNTVRAICEVVEPLGSEVYLYLTSGKNNFIARVGAHDRPEVNRDMDLVFDMSKVHFFDPKTEETII